MRQFDAKIEAIESRLEELEGDRHPTLSKLEGVMDRLQDLSDEIAGDNLPSPPKEERDKKGSQP
jgi:hypothetical protein